MMKMRMRRMIHQQLFPSKHELHIMSISLKYNVYEAFFVRLILHSMLGRKKCYKILQLPFSDSYRMRRVA